MGARVKSFLVVAALCIALFPAVPAAASFHLNKIVEVFGSATADPAAQYIEIQMFSSGQNFVRNVSVDVFDAAGEEVGSFTFATNVGSGSSQSSILVATPEAETLFGVDANLAMTDVIDPAGGKVCFSTIDCVAWGTYSGSSSGVGTPFAGALPTDMAIARDVSGGSNPTGLDGGDDTDDSAADFDAAQALPRNNAGQVGALPGEEPPPPPDDTTAPETFVVQPADSVTYRAGRLSTWRGTATDADSGIATVQVALRMTKRNGSCRTFDGSAFVSGACSNRSFLNVVFSAGEWTFDAPKLKPSIGTKIKHYTLYARSGDAAGNAEMAFDKGRNANRFEIK